MLQAVRLITVVPNARARCAQMQLTGLSFSGNWHLIVHIDKQRVVGKAMRSVDEPTALPCGAPPDVGRVEPIDSVLPCD